MSDDSRQLKQHTCIMMLLFAAYFARHFRAAACLFIYGAAFSPLLQYTRYET